MLSTALFGVHIIYLQVSHYLSPDDFSNTMPKDGAELGVSAESDTIKFLTLNTWGLKFVSKLRRERLRAIAERLANPKEFDECFDIVALQEVWVQEDWEYISNRCRNVFPYRRHFKSGVLTGPGLAILSKIPIQETLLYRFPVNGRASAFWRGDFYVGKGVAVCMLKPHRNDVRPIAILNAHMHAPYTPDGDANYACHRACQAWDIAKFQKLLRKAGYAVVQVGDLNSTPDLLPFKLFAEVGGMCDSWSAIPGKKDYTSAEIGAMTLQDQILLAGITCDSKLCTWRADRDPHEACRLDYALFDPNCFTVISADVKFTERLPAPHSCSYSDHFAYYTELLIHSKSEKEDRVQACTSGNAIKVHQDLLAEINKYCERTLPMQSLWRRWHFYLSILVVVALAVASPFLKWPQPILIVVCLLIGITGLLNGMICFFGVRVERRALQEVSLQIEDSFHAIKSD